MSCALTIFWVYCEDADGDEIYLCIPLYPWLIVTRGRILHLCNRPQTGYYAT